MFASTIIVLDAELTHPQKFHVSSLTRFDKITIQGTPHMTVDKEAKFAYRESTHTIISVGETGAS